MELNILKSPEEVLEKLADYFVSVGLKSIAAHGKFAAVLSGGSSPKKLYEMLASVYQNKLDWDKVYFFFGDERYVPQTHPDSNYLMAKKALFDPLKIAEAQTFSIDTGLPPDGAAKKYTETINHFFDGKEAHFDLVLLGLGDNSHTASLFPHTPVLQDDKPSVKEVFLEDQKVYRITLNAPIINQAHHIAFLVYGREKAAAVHHIMEDNRDIDLFPAQLIKPVNGELQWFLDDNAASGLRDHLL